MRYQRKNHQIDLLVKDEDARRLQVQLTILRDENASLNDQLVQKQCEVDQLVSDVANERDRAREKSGNLKVCPSLFQFPARPRWNWS